MLDELRHGPHRAGLLVAPGDVLLHHRQDDVPADRRAVGGLDLSVGERAAERGNVLRSDRPGFGIGSASVMSVLSANSGSKSLTMKSRQSASVGINTKIGLGSR